jgi:hypothetical protein
MPVSPGTCSSSRTAVVAVIPFALLSVLGWGLLGCAGTHPPACCDAGNTAAVAVQEPAASRAPSDHGTGRSEPDRPVELAAEPLTTGRDILLPAGLSLQVRKSCTKSLQSMQVPRLVGTVIQVLKTTSTVTPYLVTIRITDNPTAAEVKAGYSFAVWAGST